MLILIIFIMLYMAYIIYKLSHKPNNIYIKDNELILIKNNKIYYGILSSIDGPHKIPKNFKFKNNSIVIETDIIEGF